jgi:hypothetical protein
MERGSIPTLLADSQHICVCVFETNEELDKPIKHKNIINYIKAQRLSWFGHVQSMPNTRAVKKIFNWKPLTKRSQAIPKMGG